MNLTLTQETPLQDDVRRLVGELNAYLNPLSPPEYQFQMTVEQMAETATTLFVLRDSAGQAVGMGALKVHDGQMGEVKRMYTMPTIRGTGAGKVILERIEQLAREKGLSILMLETGGTQGFEPAWRVYERGGFTVRGPFLDYPESPYSKFYEKHL